MLIRSDLGFGSFSVCSSRVDMIVKDLLLNSSENAYNDPKFCQSFDPDVSSLVTTELNCLSDPTSVRNDQLKVKWRQSFSFHGPSGLVKFAPLVALTYSTQSLPLAVFVVVVIFPRLNFLCEKA